MLYIKKSMSLSKIILNNHKFTHYLGLSVNMIANNAPKQLSLSNSVKSPIKKF